jgi:hypothetical protein
MRAWVLGVAVFASGCGEAPGVAADKRLADFQRTIDESDALIAAAGPYPDWLSIDDKSPITDAPSLQLLTMSGKIDGAFGWKRVGLRVRCDEGERRVMLEWPEFVTSDDAWPVTLRFDAEPAEDMSARVTTDGASVGWDGKRADKLIERISASSKLAARVVARDGGQMTAEFITAGLQQHIPALTAACPGQ